MEALKKNRFIDAFNSYGWIFGVLLVLVYYILYMILGEDASIMYHDIMDDSIFKSVISAKYYQESGSFLVPDLMNGIPKSKIGGGITYLCRFFEPFQAYMINDFLMRCFAYIGMTLLVREILGEKYTYIAVVTSLIFVSLPFYSVHGLSAMGISFAVYGALLLYKNKHIWIGYVMVILIPLKTSIVLSGYLLIALWFCVCIYICIARRIKEKKHFLFGFAVLVAAYVFDSWNLIQTFLMPGNGSGYVSHRTERTVFPTVLSLKEVFFKGQYHAASQHQYIVLYTVFVMAVIPFFFSKFEKKVKQICWLIYSLFALALVCSLFYWVYNKFAVQINHMIPILSEFQIDRVYYIFPTLWYVVFAADTFVVITVMQKMKYKTVLMVIPVCASVVCWYGAISNPYYLTNVKRVMKQDHSIDQYSNPSWKDFYAETLFQEIDAYIGEPKADYRVVSLGMYPAIASYNGFYCLDTYLTDYPLEYKHEFRRVIADELAKSEALKSYFDEWGNRCYIFSSELGQHYLYTKNKDQVVEHLEIDTDKLYQMGCRYILSAVEIKNYEELNLTLCKVFEDDGIWKIHLYQIYD